MSLSVLKFDAVAKQVHNDPKLREFVEKLTETLGGDGFEERMAEIRADEERPFVSEFAWALYAAYAAIILGAWATMKILSIGAEHVERYIKRDHVNGLLKAVLPHQADYIDKYGEAAYYHLLEELEKNILAEMKRSLDGAESDDENIKRSSEIMAQVAKVTSDTEKLTSTGSTLGG